MNMQLSSLMTLGVYTLVNVKMLVIHPPALILKGCIRNQYHIISRERGQILSNREFTGKNTVWGKKEIMNVV